MNKELVTFIEEMGYKIECDGNISNLKIYDKDNNELNKINVPKDCIMFVDKDYRRIYVRSLNNIKIRISNSLLISARDVYDNKSNHVYMNRCIELPSLGCEINFGLYKKELNGLSHITVNVYTITSGENEPFQSIKICQDRIGALAFANDLINPQWNIIPTDCTVDNYIILLRDCLDHIFDFKKEKDVLRGFNLILPSLREYISEILELWYSHIDEYIEYLSDLKKADIPLYNDIDGIIDLLKETKNNGYSKK